MTINELKVNVENALQEIRPYLETDGGNISLVEITEDTVCVQLEGACLGCSVNQMTLKNGVEATIKRYAPQIKRVIEINGISYEEVLHFTFKDFVENWGDFTVTELFIAKRIGLIQYTLNNGIQIKRKGDSSR